MTQYVFTKGQWVVFTRAAFEIARIGMAGLWEVKDIESTEPAGSTGSFSHPQLIYLDDYPFGKKVSGCWLEPAHGRTTSVAKEKAA